MDKLNTNEKASDLELAELSRLVGYQGFIKKSSEQDSDFQINRSEIDETTPSEILDDVELIDSDNDPRQSQTKTPLRSNPFAQVALVGGGTLLLFLVAGSFLNQMFSIGSEKGNRKFEPVPDQQEPNIEVFLDEVTVPEENPYAKLALERQQQAIDSAEQQLESLKQVINQPRSTRSSDLKENNQPTPPPLSENLPTAINTPAVDVPSVVSNNSRPITRPAPTRIIPPPAQPAMPPAQLPSPLPQSPSSASQPLSPEAQWQKWEMLASLGQTRSQSSEVEEETDNDSSRSIEQQSAPNIVPQSPSQPLPQVSTEPPSNGNNTVIPTIIIEPR